MACYGSPNVAILSELNIYSLGKIYGQCENLILNIYKKIYEQWKKERNAAATIFLWWDQMFCFSKENVLLNAYTHFVFCENFYIVWTFLINRFSVQTLSAV